MVANQRISNNESDFVLESLGRQIRVDGRDLLEYRALKIEFGDDYGLVTVRLGKTKYAANVK